MRLLTFCLFTFLLSACGFHLRGAFDLPYQRFYITVAPDQVRGAELRRQIRAHHPEILVEDIKAADAVFREVGYHQDQIIAALNAEGRAREYQLRLTYSFRVDDPQGNALTPVNTIVLTRDLTYDDNQRLAKDQEIAFLWDDMNRDLALQILRRLTLTRPQAQEPGRRE
ncbi:MAG: LPS assembly lipoprotein LptE [Zoogloeaceae bacterium]|jgi:LPS-assembly lipoprotein|nr:LPS assembly lipoprotein LptE [Zoogloeaceae bacterium]